MKTRNLMLIVVFLVPLSTNGMSPGFGFHGGGGFSMTLYTPDLGFLDDKLQEVTPGFDEVAGPLVMWGGMGWLSLIHI